MAPTDKTSQRVYQHTKGKILSGEMRGGQLLSEVELSLELGVSRTPVHEAFLRLAAEDLIDMVPRRGAVVIPVPTSEAVDLLEMRLALETAAARRLCRSPQLVDQVLNDLAELIDQQRRDAEIGDVAHFAAADDRFHRRIVEAAGNTIGERFYRTLSDRQHRLMAAAVDAHKPRLTQLVEEHTQLAGALGRRDSEGFEAILLAHLEGPYQVVLR